MSGLQIFILILGAIIFTASFFVPDKQVNSKEIREKEEKAVKDILNRELANIQNRVDEAANESLSHSSDHTERMMERLSNEKIMAIDEYSNTVLDEIHKNHEEAVFLYDMLNNKHEQIKGTVADLNQTIKSAKQTVNQLQFSNFENSQEKQEFRQEVHNVEKRVEVISPVKDPVTVSNPKSVNPTVAGKETKKDQLETTTKKESIKNSSKKGKKMEKIQKEFQGADSNIEIMLGNSDSDANSNDAILALHKAGKSNMAIARELGLGIGEVKLVIDLFEGGM